MCVHNRAFSDRAQHPSSLLPCRGTAAGVANQRRKERDKGHQEAELIGRTWQSAPGPSHSPPGETASHRSAPALPAAAPHHPRELANELQTSPLLVIGVSQCVRYA